MSLAEFIQTHTWTPEVVSLMTQLWGEGVVGKKIAETLNQKFGLRLTKSAITNKAARLKLQPRKAHLEAIERYNQRQRVMREWRAANRNHINQYRRERYQSKSPWSPEVVSRLSEMWTALVPRVKITETLNSEFGLCLSFRATARKANRLFGGRNKIIGREKHFVWTQEHLDRLSALWSQCLSGTDIAAKMSTEYDRPFTRNSILGKARWLNLPNRARGGANRAPETDPVILAARAERRRQKDRERHHRNYVKKPRIVLSPEERQRRKSARELAPLVEDFAIPTPQRKSLIDLGAHDCRWPVGEPKSDLFFFCGAVAEDDRPYCPAHCKRAYVEIRPR